MKVRMFCDWDNDSEGLIIRLAAQTNDMIGHWYKDIEFVSGDEYDAAVCFNLPNVELKCDNYFFLLLEPPEIMSFHPDVRSRVYSFAEDGFLPAYGLGFATVPKRSYPPLDSKRGTCMIVSDKLMTSYHRKRHEIKEALLRTDLPIDFYGRNLTGDDPRIMGTISPMGKHKVLRDYARCIDFENSPRKVVTDKFFDPVLCNTIPVSNASILHELTPGAFDYVDFDDDVASIVNTIGSFVEQGTSGYSEPLRLAKEEILAGKMCLAEWIHQRLNA